MLRNRKILGKIAYTRHNLTLDSWLAHDNPTRTSNIWQGVTSEGVKIHICVGLEVMQRPAIMRSRTLPYGTVMPRKK